VVLGALIAELESCTSQLDQEQAAAPADPH
jgi:hypothetical protein